MATNALLILALLLIIILYLSYYSKFSKNYNITQTFLNNFSPDLLYERNPIIIYDSLATPHDLLKTIFKYQFLFSQENTIPMDKTFSVKSKFSIVYSSNDAPVLINLINPTYASSFTWYTNKKQRMSDTNISTTNISYIDVQLKKNQVIILPPHWIVHTTTQLQKIDIDDVASFAYFCMF